jgi:hypothetical protein
MFHNGCWDQKMGLWGDFVPDVLPLNSSTVVLHIKVNE